RTANSHGQRSCAGTDEGDHLGDEWVVAALRRDLVEPLAKCSGAEKHRLIGLAQPMDFSLARAPSTHTDDIEADQIGKRTLHEAKWDDIGTNPAQTHHHRAFADADELTHGCLAAEHGEVADRHVAAQHHVVGKDHIAADLAIMADVRPHHQPAAIPDFGDAAIVLCPGVDGDTFADIAIGADHELGRTAAVPDGLRRGAERGEWVQNGARANRGVAGDVNVGQESATVAEFNVGADDAIRPDRHVLPDHRARLDAGGWIDRGHRRPHATMAPTSASAPICPATFASPRNPHLFFFPPHFLTWYSLFSP